MNLEICDVKLLFLILDYMNIIELYVLKCLMLLKECGVDICIYESK